MARGQITRRGASRQKEKPLRNIATAFQREN
jgi:hypothetical protein